MTFKHKLSKRLAISWVALVLPILAACEAERRDFLSPVPPTPSELAASIHVSPQIATLRPGEPVRFTAQGVSLRGTPVAVEVDWSATGGTMQPDGNFISTGMGLFTVTARLRGAPHISGDAKVAVYLSLQDVLVLTLSPDSVELTAGEGVQFEAEALLADGTKRAAPSLAWAATGGTLDGSGWFTATDTGTYTVRATAASGVTGASAVKVRPRRSSMVALELQPKAAALLPGEAIQFGAQARYEDGSVSGANVFWSATAGTVSSSGLYRAGSTAGSYQVIARSRNGGFADTAQISIREPELVALSVAPSTSALAPLASQQYAATATLSDGTTRTIRASWRALGGTITGTGVYTAPGTGGTYRVIGEVTSSGLVDTAVVAVAAPSAELVGLIVNPSSVSVPAGTTREFAVTGQYSDGTTRVPQVAWSATGGTITSAGVYSAGTTKGSYRVIAAAGSVADTSQVTVADPILSQLVLNPPTVTLSPGAAHQFSVAGVWSDGSTGQPSVTYSATGGTITSFGVYTAGTGSGTYSVVAVGPGGLADTSLVTIAVPPPTLVSLQVSPPSVTLAPGGTLRFTVTAVWSDGGTEPLAVTWSATGGSIAADGSYQAGSVTGTYRVVATQAGGGLADSAEVIVAATAPVLTAVYVSPESVTLQTKGSRQFSVSGLWSDGSTGTPVVIWTATGGVISNDGYFVAGSVAGTYRVVAAVPNGGPADTAEVILKKGPQLVALSISPDPVTLSVGSSQQFLVTGTYSNGSTGEPAVTWSATGGTIFTSGLYQVGLAAGSFVVIASCGCGVADTATITVPSFSAPTLQRIELTPETKTLQPGEPQLFSVLGRFSDGSSTAVPVSYQATGGIMSGDVYTAGSTPGSFTVVATATGYRLADTAAVLIEGQGQTPSPGHPNEPAGYTRVAEISLTSLPKLDSWGCTEPGILAGCWWSYPQTPNLTIGSNLTSPVSPPSVLQFKLPAGLPVGASDGRIGGWHRENNTEVEYREIYESGWIRPVNVPFETPGMGWKMFGYWGVGEKYKGVGAWQVVLWANGGGNGTEALTEWPSIALHQNTPTTPYSRPQNRNTSKKLQAGQWVHYEIVLVLNDIGLKNGVARVWLDGVLVLEYTDIEFRNAANPSGFYGRHFDPVWGGIGGDPMSKEHVLEVDHIYISGKRM